MQIQLFESWSMLKFSLNFIKGLNG
jgi:hypothetical protein